MSRSQNEKKLTKRAVDAFGAKSGERSRLWDSEIKGLCLLAYPSGRKVYCVGYTHRGRYRWCTIGQHGAPWTPDTARDKAKEILGEVAAGKDPAAAQRDRRSERALTIRAMIDLYLKEGPLEKPDKRASSWTVDKSNLNNARRLIGHRVADELKPRDISKFQDDVLTGKAAAPAKNSSRRARGGRGAAIHAVRALSAMFNWAIRQELLKENPCDKITKLQDGARERYLTRNEARRLFSAIDDLLDTEEITQDQVDCLEIVSYSAARHGEIRALKWREVDFDRGLLLLPPARHKTGGTNTPKVIVMTRRIRDILTRRATLAMPDASFVFPARGKKGHLTNLRTAWLKIVAEAKIEDFRIHDFRHAYASFAINSGHSLKMIGANLGHKRASTTERYAHLLIDARRPVAEEIQSAYDELRKKAS